MCTFALLFDWLVFCFCWLVGNSSAQLMSNDLLKSVSTKDMSLTTLLLICFVAPEPQDQGRWCIGAIIISCLLFLIWHEHQHHTLYLFVWGPVNSARPAWRSDVVSNCLLFILQWTDSVPIVIRIIVVWQLQPHECGLLLLRFLLLNVVGWSLSTNSRPAGDEFLFRSRPRDQEKKFWHCCLLVSNHTFNR